MSGPINFLTLKDEKAQSGLQLRSFTAQLYSLGEHVGRWVCWGRSEFASTALDSQVSSELMRYKEHSVMYPVDLLKVIFYSATPLALR